MYNIKFESYVPKPTPATSDRIVAAHYYAAWKFGAAEIHEGFNDLNKIYPDRTPLMGYYEEENPEVCDWEIKWAIEHGVNCFIHCWYRKKECEGKKISVENLRCGHGLHEALFNARYQKMMKFAIMYEASPRWAGTDEKDMIENLVLFWMENYFTRGNYLTIDNKPVVFVYQQKRLSECFRSPESQRETFDKCREYAKGFGFDGMIFATCNTSLDEEAYTDSKKRGYDFRFGYNSGYNSPYDYFEDENAIIKGQCDIFSKHLERDERYFIPTASCFQDPSPRFTERWNNLGYKFRQWSNIWYLSPENFKVLLKNFKDICDKLPGDAWARRIIMIDNWNEWDEGHFIAPSHKYGFKFLQAIREIFTECDNLPDYRTPRDQGFESYNKNWDEPDFGEYCEKLINQNKKRKENEK